MSEEKRKYKRTRIRDVVGSYGQSEVEVVNASRGGLGLEGGSPLPVGRACLVRLHVEGRSVHVSGKISWCRLVGTRKVSASTVRPVYLGGLEYDLGSRESRPLSGLLRY